MSTATTGAAGPGAGAYPTPHYTRGARSLDDMLPSIPGSTSAATAAASNAVASLPLGPLPTPPGVPQSPRSLRILPVQSTMSNSDQTFKNDAIFKIKSTEAYLAPPDQPSHLSFRKGQAFYALNHNDTLKCFFVSTEYATPFSRTAVNGFVPDRYFEVVELNTGKNKVNAATKNSVPAAKTQTGSVAPSNAAVTSNANSKASLSSMALLAAMQQEHDRMVQNQQQLLQQQQQNSVPSMAKRHSIGATPASTAAGTPNTSQRSGGQSQQQTIAELEWELKKNADLSMSHQLSQQSLSKNSVPQSSGTNSNGGMMRAGRSREMLRNFMTSLGSAENLSNNSWQGVGIVGAPSAQDESISALSHGAQGSKYNLSAPSPPNPVALPKNTLNTNATAPNTANRHTSFFRMLFSSSSSSSGLHVANPSTYASTTSPAMPVRTSKQFQHQEQNLSSLLPPQMAISTTSGLRARTSSFSNHSRYNQSQGQQQQPHQQHTANTVTPTPPRTPFFSWRTARTPHAPTGQPSAFPYLPWISSGGSTATSPAGSVLHADSDAPPMPQIPAAFRVAAAAGAGAGGGSLATLVHVGGGGEAFSGGGAYGGGVVNSAAASGGEKSASSMGAGVGGFGQPIELERKKSNSTLGAASIGGTTMSRIKSSLKKSGSTFWLGRDG